MKTGSLNIDKRKRILKQVPLTAAEIKHLEKGAKPVDPEFYMAKAKQPA